MIGATEIREPEVQEESKVRAPQVTLRLAAPLPQAPPLFASSLLDYAGSDKRRRAGATVISVIVQCLLICVGLIVPLMFTEALPTAQLLGAVMLTPPPPPPPPAAAAVARVVRQIQSDLLSSGRLRTPSRIPQKVEMIKEEETPPPIPTEGVIGGVPGGVPGGQLGGVIGGIIGSTSNLNIVPKLAPSAPKRVRISQGVTQGMLVHRVEPAYPAIARAARIQGVVVLSAVIAKNGEIEDLTLVSGHPLLAPAAIDAVKQWRYRPYLLNGEPVEVETTITVSFLLSS